MNIVKQSTGNVVLTDASGNILKVFVMVNALDVTSSNEIIIKYGMNQWTTIFADQIQYTQIEPAGSVAFSGNAYDLVALLSSSFFFELSGGGVSQNLSDVLLIGNSASNQDIIDVDNISLNTINGSAYPPVVSVPNLSSVLLIGNSAGATAINLNNNDLLNTDKISFNTSTADTGGVAQLKWNDADGTLDLGLKGGNVSLQVGQEHVARVVNKTSPLIDLTEANYQVVRVTGAAGQRLAVKLAQADTEANCSTTLGVVTENIAKNQEGFICVLGQVHEINTTGSLQGQTWNDGDVLYLSASTAGGLTNVRPTYPNKIVVVGYVEYSHAIHGKIYVNINRTETSAIDIQAACSDETTAITSGTNKVTFRMPCAMTVYEVRASLTTAQSSGNIFTVDINESGTSILSTKLTIDNTEKTSKTAVTPAVISDSSLADDAEITVDVDQIGDGTAKGLKITLIGIRV